MADTATRRLEDALGKAVLVCEETFESARESEKRQEAARLERLAEEERRREQEAQRRREEALRQYQESLQKDLHSKVAHWREAEDTRAFLAALQRAVPEGERDEALTGWMAWAAECAQQLDPLRRGRELAVPLSRPSDAAPAASQGAQPHPGPALGDMRRGRSTCADHPPTNFHFGPVDPRFHATDRMTNHA